MADNITPEVNQEKLPVFVPPKTNLTLPSVSSSIPSLDALNKPYDYMTLAKQSQKGIKPALDAQATLLQRQEDLNKAATAGSNLVKQEEANVNLALQNQQKEQANKIQDALQDYRKTFGSPEFHPTQDNISTLTGLFSLIGVIGTAIGGQGRMSAIGALNSMTGMMKGWQEGRKDLYDREVKNYEVNFKRMRAIVEDAKSDADQAMKLLAYDVQQANAYAQQALAKLNSQVASAIAESQGIEKVSKYIDGVKKSIEEAEKRQMEGARINIEKQRLEASLRPSYQFLNLPDGSTIAVDPKNPTQPIKLPFTLQGATKPGAKERAKGTQQQQERAYNMTQNFELAVRDIKNMTSLPKDTVLGTFAGMTGQSGEGLLTSLENTFARRMTTEDQRAMQQIISGLDKNLASVMGGGYANSSAKFLLNAYREQVVRQGDRNVPITTALFLARVKQELEAVSKTFEGHPGANDNFVKQMRNDIEEINKKVPFEVDDVLKVIGKGRTTIDENLKKAIKSPVNNMIVEENVGTTTTPAAGGNLTPDEQAKLDFLRKKYGRQ